MLTEGRAHGMLTRWYSARAKLKRMNRQGQPDEAGVLKAESESLRDEIVKLMMEERCAKVEVKTTGSLHRLL